MNKLKLKFTSNNSIILDNEVSYYIKDKKLNFKIEERLFMYDIVNNILNIKDKEKELSINFNNNVIIITLLSNNIKVDYPLISSNTNIKDKSIYLEYVIEGDEIIKNVIEIEYD